MLSKLNRWLRAYCSLENWIESRTGKRSNKIPAKTVRQAKQKIPGWAWELVILAALILLFRYWLGRRDRRMDAPIEGYELPMPPDFEAVGPGEIPVTAEPEPEDFDATLLASEPGGEAGLPLVSQPEAAESRTSVIESQPERDQMDGLPATSQPELMKMVEEEEEKEQPAEEPKTTQPDDLKRIEGIGPKVANLLQSAGITTFEKLAQSDEDSLSAILKEAGLAMIKPASWPEQARLAADGDWDSLQSLQSELKGGRRA